MEDFITQSRAEAFVADGDKCLVFVAPTVEDAKKKAARRAHIFADLDRATAFPEIGDRRVTN